MTVHEGELAGSDNAREELLKAVETMIAAIDANKAVQEMASSLSQKGLWASFTGVVSGSNDKDLAGMVKRLGGSLETTQAVVQVMLRLQTRKYSVLRDFHSALLDKIGKIQGDTRTLDSNQRAAALEIVSALRDQVEDQLRQCEAVERHELQLEKIGLELERAVEVDSEFRENLRALDNQALSLRNAEAHLSREVETLQHGFNGLGDELQAEVIKVDHRMRRIEAGLDDLQSKRVQDLNAAGAWQERLRTSIERDRQEIRSSIDALSLKLDQLITQGASLERRVDQLEGAMAAKSSWRGRLQQHAMGLVGLCIALVAVVYSYKG